MFSEPSELDGYEELKPEDQAKIQKALEEGHVAEEDVPESAKKGEAGDEEEEEEDKPKKKAAKKRARDDEEGEEEAAEKPKKARATKAVSVVCLAPMIRPIR